MCWGGMRLLELRTASGWGKYEGSTSEISYNFKTFEGNFNSTVLLNIAVLCYMELCYLANSNPDL